MATQPSNLAKSDILSRNTQPAGYFRWVEQGFQSTSDWYASLTSAERAAEDRHSEERWAAGIGLFSKLTSLQQS